MLSEKRHRELVAKEEELEAANRLNSELARRIGALSFTVDELNSEAERLLKGNGRDDAEVADLRAELKTAEVQRNQIAEEFARLRDQGTLCVDCGVGPGHVHRPTCEAVSKLGLDTHMALPRRVWEIKERYRIEAEGLRRNLEQRLSEIPISMRGGHTDLRDAIRHLVGMAMQARDAHRTEVDKFTANLLRKMADELSST